MRRGGDDVGGGGLCWRVDSPAEWANGEGATHATYPPFLTEGEPCIRPCRVGDALSPLFFLVGAGLFDL